MYWNVVVNDRSPYCHCQARSTCSNSVEVIPGEYMTELRFEVGYIVKLTVTLPYSELDAERESSSNSDLTLLHIIIEQHVIAVKSFTAACHIYLRILVDSLNNWWADNIQLAKLQTF